MLYSTIVQRDETGFNQIYEAARAFEEENVLEALIACRFDIKKVEQTLNLVRIYQSRLNIESMDLVEFSETFIGQYATDHNACFRVAEKLIRRIGTTITGSMKIFRKFCPRVHRKLDGRGNIVPVLDYSRLTFRHFHGQFFGVEAYADSVKTLLHELTVFFYHLVATLKVCKDMISDWAECLARQYKEIGCAVLDFCNAFTLVYPPNDKDCPALLAGAFEEFKEAMGIETVDCKEEGVSA